MTDVYMVGNAHPRSLDKVTLPIMPTSLMGHCRVGTAHHLIGN
jgi:hypothetical protein